MVQEKDGTEKLQRATEGASIFIDFQDYELHATIFEVKKGRKEEDKVW